MLMEYQQFFHLNYFVMAHFITAGILLGSIAFIVGVLVLVHRRDQRREAAKNRSALVM
jgi:hypothetical protein